MVFHGRVLTQTMTRIAEGTVDVVEGDVKRIALYLGRKGAMERFVAWFFYSFEKYNN